MHTTRRTFMLISASLFASFYSLPALHGAHPEVPGAAQRGPIVLVGGTLHPVSGPAIANGKLLLVDGKIAALGAELEVPAEAQTIDISGQHVYPGLFDAYTELGLIEIESVRATRDNNETGTLNPNVRANVAVNPDSELIPVARSNGILLALSVPSGGLMSGQSSVLQLDGWTYEDLTLLPSAGMHIQWPDIADVLGTSGDDAGKPTGDPALKTLRETFDAARAYQKARSGGDHPFDARWEALLPVLDRQLPIIVTANRIQQLQTAIAFARQQQVRLIIYGGYDAPACAELFKKDDIPVIVAGVYRLPLRRSDDYDAPYTLPDRLRQAGIRYCISSSERFGAANVRNLPYHAATAAAFGLPADEALKAITLYPAQILGVGDRVGSLETGKDATIIVTTGNPLETTTEVRAAFIQGRQVQLDDRQKRLYRKYLEKYRRLNPAPQ